MLKENKGKIVLDLSGNLQHQLEVEYDYERNCKDWSCDKICRCGVIANTKLSVSAHEAVSLASSFFQDGAGKEGRFGFALAVRYLKHLFAEVDDFFEIRVCDGYYGEELEGIFAESGTEYHFQKQCDVFNAASNSERLKMVLEMEYGALLPDVAKYANWQLTQLAIDQVHVDKTVLKRCSNSVCQEYTHFTPWYCDKNHLWREHGSWFPGIVAIPREGGGYRVVDGFHRYKAWTSKPRGLDQQKWKKLKTNKKINIIVPIS